MCTSLRRQSLPWHCNLNPAIERCAHATSCTRTEGQRDAYACQRGTLGVHVPCNRDVSARGRNVPQVLPRLFAPLVIDHWHRNAYSMQKPRTLVPKSSMMNKRMLLEVLDHEPCLSTQCVALSSVSSFCEGTRFQVRAKAFLGTSSGPIILASLHRTIVDPRLKHAFVRSASRAFYTLPTSLRRGASLLHTRPCFLRCTSTSLSYACTPIHGGVGKSIAVVSRGDGCHHGCWPSCTCSMCYKRDTRFHTPSTWSKAGAMDAHPPRPLRRTYACEGDKIRCVEPHATQPGTSKRRGGAAQADGERRTGRHAA